MTFNIKQEKPTSMDLFSAKRESFGQEIIQGGSK
jgi:hypothetical protein